MAPCETKPMNPTDQDRACSRCDGEGFQWGSEFNDPLWFDAEELYPCASCRGSGLAKDMTLW